jgi:hypothetical protein
VRRRRVLGCAGLALGALVIVIAVAASSEEMRTRGRVRWLGLRLGSSDAATRRAARVHLLDIGRPAIDDVYPDLVATAFDEVIRADGADSYWVGVLRQVGPESDRTFQVEPGVDPVGPDRRVEILLYRWPNPTPEDVVLERLARAAARRLLVVATPFTSVRGDTFTILRCCCGLPDDEMGSRMVEALRARRNTR